MSNPQQAVSGVIGGVIGFFVGGPAGVIYGFQAGVLAGSVLFPTQLPGVQGPRLEDFETLQSDPGSPVFVGFGTFAVPGFRMYLGEPVETSNTEEVGGKGAPEQESTTFTYNQTIALGLCEGPIVGVSRIWENGKLVYDVRPESDTEEGGFNGSPLVEDDWNALNSVWGIIREAAQFGDIDWVSIGFEDGMPLTPEGAEIMTRYWAATGGAFSIAFALRSYDVFATIPWSVFGYLPYADRLSLNEAYADTFVLYTGTEEQLPDPTLEAEQGVGNVPAFRGLSYLVYPNRLLKPEQGNRHPVFKIEVGVQGGPPTQQLIQLQDHVIRVESSVVGGGGAIAVVLRNATGLARGLVEFAFGSGSGNPGDFFCTFDDEVFSEFPDSAALFFGAAPGGEDRPFSVPFGVQFTSDPDEEWLTPQDAEHAPLEARVSSEPGVAFPNGPLNTWVSFGANEGDYECGFIVSGNVEGEVTIDIRYAGTEDIIASATYTVEIIYPIE